MDTASGPFLKSALRAALSGMALLLAAGTLAPAAMAAPCPRDDCENVARALPRTQVPVSVMTVLTIRIVDLGEAEATDTPERSARLSESMAPLLFLTPRVTSILEDVFNDDDRAGASQAAKNGHDTDSNLGERPAAESDERPTSPVAGTDTDGRYGPLPALDNGAVLPKFQRQMYRTDI